VRTEKKPGGEQDEQDYALLVELGMASLSLCVGDVIVTCA
jgi:hypothetical protein